MGKIVFVASGGGVRGFAHIGALKACFERDLVPDEYVGTSAGAMVCALAAAGVSLDEIEDLGRRMKSRHVLDINYGKMLSPRQIRGIIKGERLQRTLLEVLPTNDFKKMHKGLYINTTEMSSGYQVFWGQDGFDDVPVHLAVLASCCIPGIFVPVKLRGSYYVDGGVVDNLPVQYAANLDADLVIAVNLGFSVLDIESMPVENMNVLGAIYHTGAIMMQSRLRLKLKLLKNKNLPYVLIEPKLRDYEMFDFDHFDDLLMGGYNAACRTLDENPLIKAYREG